MDSSSLGGGKSRLPSGVRLDLELLDIRRFPYGSTYVSYRPVVSNQALDLSAAACTARPARWGSVQSKTVHLDPCSKKAEDGAKTIWSY